MRVVRRPEFAAMFECVHARCRRFAYGLVPTLLAGWCCSDRSHRGTSAAAPRLRFQMGTSRHCINCVPVAIRRYDQARKVPNAHNSHPRLRHRPAHDGSDGPGRRAGRCRLLFPHAFCVCNGRNLRHRNSLRSLHRRSPRRRLLLLPGCPRPGLTGFFQTAPGSHEGQATRPAWIPMRRAASERGTLGSRPTRSSEIGLRLGRMIADEHAPPSLPGVLARHQDGHRSILG